MRAARSEEESAEAKGAQLVSLTAEGMEEALVLSSPRQWEPPSEAETEPQMETLSALESTDAPLEAG